MHTVPCFTKTPDDLHTGMPFVTPVPRISVIRVRSAPKNATLQLVDGLRVATQLRSIAPKAFRVLSETLIDYEATVPQPPTSNNSASSPPPPKKYSSALPVFTVNPSNGNVERVVFNNALRARRSSLPDNELMELYAALKEFGFHCYDRTNEADVHVSRGDMLVLANDRVLHGHSAWDGDDAKSGCMLDESFVTLNGWDPIKRRLRDLV